MTRLLLDTHIFVWAKTFDRPLREDVVASIVDPENEVSVSLATAWELSIKAATGKLTGDASKLIGSQAQFERILSDSRFDLLSILTPHIFAVRNLPLHHRDPFDRLIVAQAMTEGMTLITADRRLEAYAGLDMIVGA
jgi:PIN domain nuclease of toxin-antitoxin system